MRQAPPVGSGEPASAESEPMEMEVEWRRVVLGLMVLAAVMAAGTIGYLAFGFGALDALYQTVTTVTTVGFREVRPLSDGERVFTMGLILVGAGAALYTLSALIETLVGGELGGTFGRRRMQRHIARMKDHVILCGWGRVGRSIARELVAADEPHVIIDRDPEKLEGVTGPHIIGDATEDSVLKEAGLGRARALVAALENDAGNLFVTLSVRTLRPDIFIVSRVRIEDNEEKLRRAGADRVINPQSIGGARAAAFVLQPHVSEFLDVVMHDRDIEFRLEELDVAEESVLAGSTIRDAHIRDETGALVLALREQEGTFVTNPAPDQQICAGQILIAIGTKDELEALEQLVSKRRT
jgi:voltage-gated potassium channel